MIIAVDFDGTLCESKYPYIGIPNVALIDCLKQMRSKGDKLILWTCRCGDRLNEAVAWCLMHGLEFDAINDNLPESITEGFENCRKVYADIYLDDKSKLPQDMLNFSSRRLTRFR